MNNTFFSLVSVHQDSESISVDCIHSIDDYLKKNFSDYEIIIVNNGSDKKQFRKIHELEDLTKKNITIVNLSKKVEKNSAVIAGLDQANGDYTAVIDLSFWENPMIILNLYNKIQNGFDIVYFRQSNRKMNYIHTLIYKMIYYVINRFSEINIDMNMYFNFLISRRALNSLLQLRERQVVQKAIFTVLGYATSYIELEFERKGKFSFTRQIKDAVILITFYTNILSKILFISFISSAFFSILMIGNGLMVKLFQINILGSKVIAVPGWSYIIVMNSITFSVLILILYIFSIYLSIIQSSVKKGPLYFLESIERL